MCVSAIESSLGAAAPSTEPHAERYDDVTGLPGRALFVERAAEALRERPGGSTVLVIGVDRFAEINDTLGHHIGDRVLDAIAARLVASLPEDALLARLAGDEYAVLCPGLHDVSTAVEAAGALRARVEAPLVIDAVTLSMEVSVGISTQTDPDVGELLRRADVALTHAKARQGGIEVYSADHDIFDERRLRLLTDLRAALAHGELVLHYQPKIDLPTKRVTGVEALLRWEHPELGVVPPLDFIPLIERTALIDAVTKHVIELALRQVAAWRELGLRLDMAVNLSARNLLDLGLPDRIERLLQTYAVPASQLIVEVTESGVMVDPERAAGVLADLRERGVGVSIDDFGTGNASLAYLARLPATELKIDRSFVSAALDDPRADAIVRASNDLARHFGLTVVAEGIETDAAMEHLTRVGCAVGQGYRISRPLPAADLTARLTPTRAGAPEAGPAPGASARRAGWS